MSNKRIRVTELEFDTIKDNLKEFLKGQTTFSDYDFEGSNLAILLDVLAYNTHYNALYTNFAVNEVFLDSASKRDSVVSLARSIGYTPRSAICSSAVITFTVSGTNTTPPFLTLPAYTSFFGIKEGVRYNFYIEDDISAPYNSIAGSYTFTQIPIKEGTPLKNSFLYTANNKYIIPNANVDTTTLKVSVQKSSSDNETFVYTPASDLSLVTFDSKVYFLKEIEGGLHQIEFGDDNLGVALEEGNIIIVEYLVSNGAVANRITTFSYGGSAIDGSSNISVTTVTPSFNGRDPETTDEIRFNAPNFYAAQNRAVTIEDYKVLLKQVASVGDVVVWGGEDNVPPVYGKVFISAFTPEGRNFNTQQKIDLNNAISKFKIATVQTEIIDVEFFDVDLNVSVYYDQTQTNKNPQTILSDVLSAYAIYNETTLQKFNSIIRNSEIVRTAEEADSSIINVVPKLSFRYTLNVSYNLNTNYTINLKNPILNRKDSIKSTGFYCSESTSVCYIDSTEEGTLTLYSVTNSVRKDIRTVGSVSFETGSFVLNNLRITSLVGSQLYFNITAASPDIVGFNNKVVRLDLTTLKVNVIADGNVNGQLKTAYNFTTV